MAESFSENIRISWDIQQALQSSVQLKMATEGLRASVRDLKGEVADFATSASGQILGLVLDVEQLTRAYQQAAQAARDMNAAAGARPATYGAAPGGGVSRQDVTYASQVMNEWRRQQREGVGGGGGYDSTYYDPGRFTKDKYTYTRLMGDVPVEFQAERQWAGNYAQLSEGMMLQKQLMSQYAIQSQLGAFLPGPGDIQGHEALGRIRGEMMGEISAYNLGAQQDAGFAQVREVEESKLAQQRLDRFQRAQYMMNIEQKARAERERAFTPVQEEAKHVDALSNSWMRHIGWLAQTAIILGTVKLAYDFVSTAVESVITLTDATARLAFVNEQSQTAVRPGLLAAATETAQYGIRPQDVYGGELIEAQYGVGEATSDTAAKIAFALGVTDQYGNIVQEVAQVVRRSNGAFDDQTRILDLVALLYQNANLSVEEYFDAIGEAIPLSRALGLSIEETALIIAKTAQDLEKTPEVAAGLFGKIVQRTAQEDVRRQLQSQFGIVGESAVDIVSQTSQAMTQFIAQGNEEAARQLATLVSGGGGAQSRQDLIRLADAMRDFVEIQNQSIDSTNKWGELFGQVGTTFSTTLVRLTGEARNFINVWANTGPVMDFFTTLQARLDGVANSLHSLSVTMQGQDVFGGLSEEEQRRRIDEFNKKIGYEAVRMAGGGALGPGGLAFTPNMQMIQQAWQSVPGGAVPAGFLARLGAPVAAQQALAQAFFATMGGGASAGTADSSYFNRYSRPGEVAGGGGGPFQFKELGPFGGIRELPEGMTAAQIQASANEFDTQIRKMADSAGIAYTAESETYLLLNTVNGSFSAVKTTSDALALAMRNAKSAVDDFAGFRDMPKGLNFDQLIASIAIWTTRIKGYEPGAQDYEKEQRTAFWDPVTRQFKTITAPMDALKFAIEEQTKALNRISGVFNVPAGGEVMVPFYALQQGFVPSTMTSGASGGVRGPGPFNQTPTPRDWLDTLNTGVPTRAGRERTPRDWLDILNSGSPTGTSGGGGGGGGGGGAVNVVVNNRNQINLDGRVIATALQTTMHRSLNSVRRSMTSGNLGALLVG